MLGHVTNRFSLFAVIVCGFVLFCAHPAIASSGTQTSRTLTFADTSSAVATVAVKGDQFAGTRTTVWFQFTGDGSTTPLASSVLAAVVFKLGKDGGSDQSLCIGLDTDGANPPCSFIPPSQKRIQFTLEEPSTSLYRLDITHKNGIGVGVTESWKITVTGIPAASPPLRGMAFVQGAGAQLTPLTPAGPCGGGQCPPCPSVCPAGQSCQAIGGGPSSQWWRFMNYYEVYIHWPFPPPPPCLSCPEPWQNPIRDGFERVLVSVVPYSRPGVPLGPGRANQVKLDIKGGEPVGGLVDVGQGEYLQLIEYRKGRPPRVSATAAGITSEEVMPGARDPGARGVPSWLLVLAGLGAGFGISRLTLSRAR